MSGKKVSFLAALCLFLSAIEYAIPKPLPFMRLGLANLPVLLSLSILNTREYILLVLFKIIAQALVSGTLFSYIFIFSLAGSISSAIAMLVFYKIFSKTSFASYLSYSLAGSLFNNISQIVCSYFIVFKDSTRYIAPLLLLSGLVTGSFLGIFTNLFIQKSRWYNFLQNTDNDAEDINILNNDITKKQSNNALLWLFTGLIGFILLLALSSLWLKWCVVALFIIILLIKRKGKVKILPSLLITITITIFAMLEPSGKILYEKGFIKITQGALTSGLTRSSVLVGMVFISQTAVSKEMHIPGKAGNFIGRVFAYLDYLTQNKLVFKDRNIIEVIDNHLMNAWGIKADV